MLVDLDVTSDGVFARVVVCDTERTYPESVSVAETIRDSVLACVLLLEADAWRDQEAVSDVVNTLLTVSEFEGVALSDGETEQVTLGVDDGEAVGLRPDRDWLSEGLSDPDREVDREREGVAGRLADGDMVGDWREGVADMLL